MNATEELKSLLEETGLSPEDGKVVSDLIDRIEHEYMERPKDADGMPIEIGDTVGCEERYTHVGGEDVVKATGKVEELVRSASGWTVYVDSWDDSFPSDCVKHVKPDSWDRLFDDVQRTGHAPHTNDEWIKRAKALSERGA